MFRIKKNKKMSNNEITPIIEEESVDQTATVEENSGEYINYTYIGDNTYMPLNEIKTTNTLPSGLYSIDFNDRQNSFTFYKNNFQTDKLYELPIDELSLIKNDISKFWTREKKFKEYGLVHKRGLLLYGKPGCGKSCAIQLVMKDLIDNHNGLIFKISNRSELDTFLGQFNQIVRKIEPKRKVVVIMEDIDGLFDYDTSVQTRVLNLLDGINQNSNILYVATTNFPEKLQERILNRPSRFDKRYEFRLPNPEIRRVYLLNSLKENDLKNIDLQYWIDETEGLSLSHLRELIVSVIILENDFDTEIKTLKDMGTPISSSSYRTSGVNGFKQKQTTGFIRNKSKTSN